MFTIAIVAIMASLIGLGLSFGIILVELSKRKKQCI